MPRQTTHVCSKETEIALIKQRQDQDRKLLEEIHSAVVGTDNKPGIKDRVGKIETSLENTKTMGKVVAWIIGVFMTILGWITFNK